MNFNSIGNESRPKYFHYATTSTDMIVKNNTSTDMIVKNSKVMICPNRTCEDGDCLHSNRHNQRDDCSFVDECNDCPACVKADFDEFIDEKEMMI